MFSEQSLIYKVPGMFQVQSLAAHKDVEKF